MGLFSKKEKKETLNQGLNKTKESFFAKLSKTILGKSTVDDSVLDNLEETLITSDVGVETTLKIIERLQERIKRDKYISTSELNSILRAEIATVLRKPTGPFPEDFDRHLPCRRRRTAAAVGRPCGRPHRAARHECRPGLRGLRYPPVRHLA